MKVVQNSNVVTDWQYFAGELGLTDREIDDIEGEVSGLRDR